MTRKFEDVPSEYYMESNKKGKLVRIHYVSNTYNASQERIDKDALVYLPHDYDDSNNEYNVLYLMHGGGGDSNELFGGIKANTDLKNILDNMISNGYIEPLIVVTPSFYYEGTTLALTSTIEARMLTQNFHNELVNDLIPVVEKEFRVQSGREHRGFGGYSMGAETTWNIFAKCLKEFKYFMPMSGDCWAVELQGGLKEPKETVEYLEKCVKESGISSEEYSIFACVGDNGVAYKPMDTMINEMRKHKKYFVFSENFNKGNIIYCVAHGGTHSYDYCYKYIYNVLPLFFC